VVLVAGEVMPLLEFLHVARSFPLVILVESLINEYLVLMLEYKLT